MRALSLAGLLSLVLLLPPGCSRPGASLAGLPDRYQVDLGELLIRSDVRIPERDPLLSELKTLRREVTELLDLPPPRRPVVVHLFADEEKYTEYMQASHPNLPPRRAFFIGSPTELGVYAHWSPHLAEDLRHEYTHGILHASLKTVPLWLDEGLAEYFEVPPDDSLRRHGEHLSRLKIALHNGWRPDLRRLEQIETVNQMQRADYQEAWAWVHFLLHEAPDGRELLVDYCRSLRSSDKPPRFSDRLNGHFPDAELRLTSYLSTTLGAARNAPPESGAPLAGTAKVRL